MTAQFLSPLRVEELEDGRKQLLEDLVFYSAELDQDDSDLRGGILIAPAGSVTDYASVPRGFWNLFPPGGPWKWAAVMHDGGYTGTLVTAQGCVAHLIKPLSDRLFREAMTLRPDIGARQRELMYRLVRRFGGRVYGGLGAAA